MLAVVFALVEHEFLCTMVIIYYIHFAGIPFPVNSLGVLPVNYLDGSERLKAESLFLNAKQILAQYRKKQSTVKATAIMFRPYKLTGV